MMITAMLMLMISAATSTETAPLPPPYLCLDAPGSDLMAGRCVDAATNPIDVVPDAKTRGWIWIDSARKTIAFGTLAPDQSKIVIDASGRWKRRRSASPSTRAASTPLQTLRCCPARTM